MLVDTATGSIETAADDAAKAEAAGYDGPFTGGRFVLGLGTQVKAHIQRRFSIPWGRPAAQMREFVLALRDAWGSWADGTPLDFEGEYYRHTLMPPRFVPIPHDFGPPPVYIAGVGDAITRVAGEVADGSLCHAFTTERWIREHSRPALVEGRRRSGQSMDGFTVKAAIRWNRRGFSMMS